MLFDERKFRLDAEWNVKQQIFESGEKEKDLGVIASFEEDYEEHPTTKIAKRVTGMI